MLLIGTIVALQHRHSGSLFLQFEITTRVEIDHMRIMMRNINVRAFTRSGEENSVQLLNYCNSLFAQFLCKFDSLTY